MAQSLYAKVLAISVVAMVIALISLGVVAYNSYRLNVLTRGQHEINEKLGNVSKSILSIRESVNKLADLYTRLDALSKYVDDLYNSISNIKENQSLQSKNIKKALEFIKDIEKEIESLKEELSSHSSSLAGISSKIEKLENQIDEVYNLLMYPVTVTDATGKPITLSERPKRIVSLLPSVTEILWTVNASKQVIAVDEYSNYPPKIHEELENGTLVNIGSGWYPNVELILSLKPDLIIGVDSVISHHTIKKIFAEYGVPVVLLPDRNFEDILDSIIIVGKLTGHPAEAAEVVTKLKDEALALRSYINNFINETKASRQKLALVIWPKPLWVAGNSTFQDDLIKLAGGLNAYSYISGWQSVSPESLLKANPDVIVITLGYSGINMTRKQFINYLKGILGDSVYNISAVKNKRIYFIVGEYNDILNRPGPRVVRGAELLAVLLYPKAFNLTPDKIPERISPETFIIPSIKSG